MPEIAWFLQKLWEVRRLLVLVALVALFACIVTLFKVTTSPPFVESRSLTVGVASAEMLVDSDRSVLGDLNRSIEPLTQRSLILARIAQSAPVRALIAQKSGEPAGSFAIQAAGVKEPTGPERGQSLAEELFGTRVILRAPAGLPVVNISTQAPSAARAQRLAKATTESLQQYFQELQGDFRPSNGARVTLKVINLSGGGEVTSGTSVTKGIAVALGVFIAGSLLVVFLQGLVAEMRSRGGFRRGPRDPDRGARPDVRNGQGAEASGEREPIRAA